MYLIVQISALIIVGVVILVSFLKYANKKNFKDFNNFLEILLFFFPKKSRKKLEETIELSLDNVNPRFASNIITFLLIVLSIFLISFSYTISRVWYVSILLIVFSSVLPFYFSNVIQEVFISRINKKLPELIDEFNIAYLDSGRVQIALEEAGNNIGGRLGAIISKTSFSGDLNKSLSLLKNRLSNVWFNIFIIIILNKREYGGDFKGQLRELSNTITKHNIVTQRRNRKIMMFEFAVILITVFTIPIGNVISRLFIQRSFYEFIDTDMNMVIMWFILFSIFAMILLRSLRK